MPQQKGRLAETSRENPHQLVVAATCSGCRADSHFQLPCPAEKTLAPVPGKRSRQVDPYICALRTSSLSGQEESSSLNHMLIMQPRKVSEAPGLSNTPQNTAATNVAEHSGFSYNVWV